MLRKTLPDIHPGEILLEEFLKPMDISQNASRPQSSPHRRRQRSVASNVAIPRKEKKPAISVTVVRTIDED
jgi:hypothetical protein